MSADIVYKILILGDVGTGKTSIMQRYINNVYSSNYKSTIGVDFYKKQFVIDDTEFTIQCWEVSGQDRFCNFIKMFCKGTNLIILVVDIGRIHYVQDVLDNWLELIDKIDTNNDVENVCDKIPILIVINKCDDKKFDSMVTVIDDMIMPAICSKKNYNIKKFFMVSAKDNIGIGDVFNESLEILKENDESKNKGLLVDVTNQTANTVGNKCCG